MPRGEKPLDMTRGPVAEFAAELRALRRAAGAPTYRTLAGRANYSVTVLSQAAAGVTAPAWPVVNAFVTACGGDSPEWKKRWQVMRRDQEVHDTAVAQPPPSEPPVSGAFQTVRDAQDRQIHDGPAAQGTFRNGSSSVNSQSERQALPVALTVFLLDDHELVRTGLRALMESQPDMTVVGEAATAAEARARLPVLKPDVAILDIRLPDESGIEVCRFARTMVEPPPACMMLTSYADEDAMITAIHAGAAAYLIKDIRGEDVIAAVRVLAAGQSLLDAWMAESAMERLREKDQDFRNLARREREIFELLGEGLSRGQIAERLYLSARTVDGHLHRIMRKLGVSRTSEAVAIAARIMERRRNSANA